MINFKSFDQFINEGNAMGDCYQAAGRLSHRFLGDKNAKLVHGMVHGQGKLSGIKYGHAWVEWKDKVLDHSNGKKIELPKAIYYAMGNITPKDCIYYTPDDSIKWTMKTKHWGPWEMSGDSVTITENIPSDKKEIGDIEKKVSRKELEQIKELI